MSAALAEYDIAIIGAGAAGMTAAIFAAEAANESGEKTSIVLIEGARNPGAKILVSGGGRCNVTNDRVSPEDYCGGSRPVIRNVLKAFDENRARDWFASMGVELKLEPTGKYFPVTDKARTVLGGLLARIEELEIEIKSGQRVCDLYNVPDENPGGLWRIERAGANPLLARRVIMATGGRSLPKSGSDGWGLEWLAAQGLAGVAETPALVPLVLRAGPSPTGRFADAMGLVLEARLDTRDERGKLIASVTGAVLFTHFGVSGPAAMDVSRHWLRAKMEGLKPGLFLGHPDFPNFEAAERWLLARVEAAPAERVAKALAEIWPARWAEMFAEGLTTLGALKRETRRELAHDLAGLAVPVLESRGWSFAETTAGGVDLREIDARTMAVRRLPGLHVCGEALDVDGRIGGFNFQWAWASGYLAGRGAARMLRGA